MHLPTLALGTILGFILAGAPTIAQTFDERKWERLQQQREVRRATEYKYETCARACQEKCK